MQAVFSFLGRLCISAIFIFSGLQDLLNWNAQEEYVVHSLTDSLSAGGLYFWIIPVIDFVLSNMTIFFAAAFFLKLCGGVFVLFNWNPRLGSVMLLLFLIPVTLLIHDFWNKPDASKGMEMIMFSKNLGLVGGLFLLLSQGSSSKKKESSVEEEAT
ncbi:MAG: DoxX family membrane protein [Chlamydiae bacterium]|nr:DoxX family membrane protein [Chlamydiota bacterium]